MPLIAVPKVLRDKLGEDATEAFVEVIKSIDLEARKDALVIAEERFEKKLTEMELRIEKRFSEIEKRFSDMERRFTDILKWMFIFWASQLGFIFAILKFMIK